MEKNIIFNYFILHFYFLNYLDFLPLLFIIYFDLNYHYYLISIHNHQFNSFHVSLLFDNWFPFLSLKLYYKKG